MNHEYKTGDKVRYLNASKHFDDAQYYPAVGTIGEVAAIDEEDVVDYFYVAWPEGSTSGNDLWWCSREDVEPVEDEDVCSKCEHDGDEETCQACIHY